MKARSSTKGEVVPTEVLALAPLVLLGLALVGYCLVDIARAGAVRYLPKWA